MTENLLDKVLIARYTYACGQPLFGDAEYDALNAELKDNGITLNPIYEDSVPYD